MAHKRATKDYAAQRVRITLDGEELYVVVDGHHSIAAARADGHPIVWQDAHPEIQQSANWAVDNEVEHDWMAEHEGDAEWYDIATGRLAW